MPIFCRGEKYVFDTIDIILAIRAAAMSKATNIMSPCPRAANHNPTMKVVSPAAIQTRHRSAHDERTADRGDSGMSDIRGTLTPDIFVRNRRYVISTKSPRLSWNFDCAGCAKIPLH